MKKILPTLFAALSLMASSLFFAGQNNFQNYHAETYDPASGATYYTDPEKYYQGIDPTLTGEDLVVALSTLTSTGFVGHSYSSLPNIYQYSDLSNGQMRMVYTGTERSFSPGSMPGSTNKEHVWPASWYGTGNREEGSGSPGADAHNVWPSASDLNSKRGSCAFDELDFSSSWKCYEFGTYDYGTAGDNESFVWSTAFNNSNGQPDDIMYPSKGHRGEIARILMYVATRYHNDTRFPVMLHDKAVTLKEGKIGKLSTLLKWHYLEPPTEWEINRNNIIAEKWHHNRNPFIDNPEYATLIYEYLPEPGQSQPTDAVLDVIETYGRVEYDDPTSIEVDSTSISLGINQEHKIEASIKPATAKQSVGYTSSNPNVASVSSDGLVTALKEGKATINVFAKENPSIYVDIEVNIKKMVKIELSGVPNKLTYYTNDIFDPTGLSVKGIFTDNSFANIPLNECRWLDDATGLEKLADGSTKVRCVYNDLSAVFEGITVIHKEFSGYEKLTEPLSDYSGRYLLVNETFSKILDGSVPLTSKNSVDQIQISISENQIVGDYAENEFTLSKFGSGYKLTSSYGQSFGATSTGGFSSGDNFVNTVNATETSTIIQCNNLTLRYNANYFRYYKTSTQGDPIFLYRFIDGGEGQEGLEQARSYATRFMSSNLCGINDNTPADSAIWLQLQDEFNSLDSSAKAILQSQIGDQNSSDVIKQCLARYDRVIYLHGQDQTSFPDFMNRNEEGVYATNIHDNLIGSNNVIIISSIILTISSLVIVGLAFIKRKQNIK